MREHDAAYSLNGFRKSTSVCMPEDHEQRTIRVKEGLLKDPVVGERGWSGRSLLEQVLVHSAR